MAPYQISIDREMLQQLFVKDEGLGQLLEQVLNQVLQAQMSEQLKADFYQRTDDRQGYRNGHRERRMKSRVGDLCLLVPRTRSGTLSTEMFERYQRSEQALILAMMEMVVNGVSTRKVNRILQELCGIEFSKSSVSEFCKRLDPLVREWNGRNLNGQVYPFLVLDALAIKVRKSGRVRIQSVLVAIGINGEGRREVLGLMTGERESQVSWAEFFRVLKERGLNGVDLVVSDDHSGLVKAIHGHFSGATWQRCQTHFKRNILDGCPKKDQKELAGRLRLLFDAPGEKIARGMLAELLRDFGGRAPKAMKVLETGFEDAIAVLALPIKYRVRLRSTNGMERLNREIRRRERVIGIFPNEDSALRLLGAVLIERDEDWSVGKLYFNMDEYWYWRKVWKEEGVIMEEAA